MYYTWECVIQKKSSGFAFNSSQLPQKLNYNNIEKMPSDRGNPAIYVIFRGVSPKISFWYGLYMIACFHEHFALKL